MIDPSSEWRGYRKFLPAKFDENEELIAPAASPADASFFTVSHMRAFCGNYYANPPDKMFKNRAPVMEVSARFDAETTLFLNGSPGTGKSLTAWKLMCDRAQAASEGVCLYWIHATVDRVVLFRNRRVMFYNSDHPYDPNMFDRNTSHIVIDGVTNHNQAVWVDRIVDLNGRLRAGGGGPHIMVCSSAQLHVGQKLIDGVGAVSYVFLPWSLAEFTNACHFDPFYALVHANLTHPTPPVADPATVAVATRDEQVQDKFALAGFSSRYMFDKTSAEVLADLSHHFSRLSNTQDLITGLQGSRSYAAINHMLYSFGDGQTTPVSAVVVRWAVINCGYEIIPTMTACAQGMNNPSFDGWVLEFDVLYMLKHSIAARFFRGVATGVPGEYTQGAAADTLYSPPGPGAAPLQKPIQRTANNELHPLLFSVGQWFYPMSYNNAGFDAVQLQVDAVTGQRVFRFIQITRALTHSLKLQLMATFIIDFNAQCAPNGPYYHLRIDRAQVVVIVPMRENGTMHFDPPTDANTIGSLAAYGWNNAQLEVVGCLRGNMPGV